MPETSSNEPNSLTGLYKRGDNKSRHHVPGTGGGFIDVVKDFSWTTNPKSSRYEVPSARLVEYQQDTGQIVASFLHFYRNASATLQAGNVGDVVNMMVNGSEDPFDIYKFKYLAKKTGFTYNLPYFGDLKSSRQTAFGYDSENRSPFAGLADIAKAQLGYGAASVGIFRVAELATKITEGVTSIAGVASSFVPGQVGLEDTQSWRTTSAGEYEITFDLFNTGGIADIRRNRDFLTLIEYQSTSFRRNLAVTDPPTIYSLHIPDVCSVPAAYISSMNISNVGMKRSVPMGNRSMVIPEAYRISIQLTSMLNPSRNILLGLDNDQVVQAFGTVGEAAQVLADDAQTAADALGLGNDFRFTNAIGQIRRGNFVEGIGDFAEAFRGTD